MAATPASRPPPSPPRKTIEEFDFAFQTSLRRDNVLHLAQLDFLAGKENVILLGPPGTGKSHLAIAIGIRGCLAGHRVFFKSDRMGRRARRRPTPKTASTPNSTSCNASRC